MFGWFSENPPRLHLSAVDRAILKEHKAAHANWSKWIDRHYRRRFESASSDLAYTTAALDRARERAERADAVHSVLMARLKDQAGAELDKLSND